jgi:hypothetical protein
MVSLNGPDSLISGQSAIYNITIKGGPHITGGFNVASHTGNIDTVSTDPGVKEIDNELTHAFPRTFQSDSVTWTFKYTEPNTIMTDTLYSAGNSTNNNGLSDTADAWNFSINKIVRVYIPIGIMPISNYIPDAYRLSQNYPNPFNPQTNIRFSVRSNDNIKLIVFDLTGKIIRTLINEKLNPGIYEFGFSGNDLSSGIYFYSMIINGKVTDTKKMMLIK